MTYPDVRGVLTEDLVVIRVDVQPIQISEKSRMRLHAAQKAAKYYEMIHCDLTLANTSWSVLKIFEEQWDELVERRDIYDIIIPKLAKGISVTKWLESVYLYLRTVVGKRATWQQYMTLHPP